MNVMLMLMTVMRMDSVRTLMAVSAASVTLATQGKGLMVLVKVSFNICDLMASSSNGLHFLFRC